jgi:hypothetical protein
VGQLASEEQANYALFGVLLAVLFAVMAAIIVQRRR